MSSLPHAPGAADTPVSVDGFDVLDACHRQTVLALGKLAALVSRLAVHGPDAPARALAGEIVAHFSATSRQHHDDEERHVFPALLASADPGIVQDVLRLQQDHHWIETDWRELEPHLSAVASGQSWYDLDTLRDGAATFTALAHEHIALEESCIYPQARARLGGGARHAMAREMAARRRRG
jgi:iron-sulfur cluster repair protein YtfE (RIC family)